MCYHICSRFLKQSQSFLDDDLFVGDLRIPWMVRPWCPTNVLFPGRSLKELMSVLLNSKSELNCGEANSNIIYPSLSFYLYCALFCILLYLFIYVRWSRVKTCQNLAKLGDLKASFRARIGRRLTHASSRHRALSDGWVVDTIVLSCSLLQPEHHRFKEEKHSTSIHLLDTSGILALSQRGLRFAEDRLPTCQRWLFSPRDAWGRGAEVRLDRLGGGRLEGPRVMKS